jgi:hypothetical protein
MNAFLGVERAAIGQAAVAPVPVMPVFKPEAGYTDEPISSKDVSVTIDYSHIASNADEAADRVIQSIGAEITKLQKIKASEMTDGDTRQAANAVATIDALMDWLRRDYPDGVPVEKAKIIEQLLADLNQLGDELKQRRVYYYIKDKIDPVLFSNVVKSTMGASANPAAVLKSELTSASQGGEAPMIEKTLATQSVPVQQPIEPPYHPPLVTDTVPGTPGSAVDVVATPLVEKKKFPVGPVVAVGAGILATWFALR